MITTEAGDLYSTREPMDQFHQRIRFCLGIRNQAIKAMRYPPKQYSKDLESAEVSKVLVESNCCACEINTCVFLFRNVGKGSNRS